MTARRRQFDFVVIGTGPAGEAAAFKARELGASVAVVERHWFGGSCPHIGCIPSKSLLNSAAVHFANATHQTWAGASARRDWIVNRPQDASDPDDSGHRERLEQAGAVTLRGSARIEGIGRVGIRGDGASQVIRARHVVVAVGSVAAVPPIPGLDRIVPWTNREATLARQLPRSLLVLGGGPSGCELAQAYARFGVPVIIVQSGARLAPTDHPRNSDAIADGLRASGVDVRLGARAVRVDPGQGRAGAHRVALDDGSTAQGHEILLAVGRTFPLDDLGLEHYGLDTSNRVALPRDGRLRMADGLWMVGDPAGPELHTHQAHYQGEMAVRMAMGEDVRPDYRALPRATYTDPEAAFVGVTLDAARAEGLDAFELTADFPTTAKGYSVEATTGHVSIVVDRTSRELVGAAMACPDASAAIHECVLAIQARVPIAVLAETIHAFPSTSRILNGLFADAARELKRP
jgi:pyruvate/2-oxoglutarate dehydrogenase complex dihydrolipoamide dehydrogenase (E3) component